MKQLSLILIITALISSCKTDCPDPVPYVNPDLWSINDIKYSNGEIYFNNVYQSQISTTTIDIEGGCEIKDNGVFILDYTGTQLIIQGTDTTENPMDETIAATYTEAGNKFTIDGNSLYAGEWDIISETSTTSIMSIPRTIISDDGSGNELRIEFDLIMDLAK